MACARRLLSFSLGPLATPMLCRGILILACWNARQTAQAQQSPIAAIVPNQYLVVYRNGVVPADAALRARRVHATLIRRTAGHAGWTADRRHAQLWLLPVRTPALRAGDGYKAATPIAAGAAALLRAAHPTWDAATAIAALRSAATLVATLPVSALNVAAALGVP